MKKLILFFSFLITFLSFSQEKVTNSYLETEYFYGKTLKHLPNIAHLITGNPEGFILSWNKKSDGKKTWQQDYNYPDVGISFLYQDYKNEIVGKLFAIYGHYNFYLLNRNNKNQLILRTGVGLAYNTKPYDKETNNKNIAFGTHLNSSTYLKLYYQRENIIKNIGINAGLSLIHASNSNVKSPNFGLNTLGATVGLNYNLSKNNSVIYEEVTTEKYTEPIKYNIVIRGGINESPVIGSGLHPFYVLTGYADKRLSRKSSVLLGVDVFISPFLKDYIEYSNINFPDKLVETSDISRVGLFIGHELFIGKLSVISQVGYYLHYPFPYGTRVYERLGLKRYINDKWFATISVKAHGVDAETVEFGFGYRF